MTENSYTATNAKVIDHWVKTGWQWGQPISHETYQRAQAGEWKMLLTPTKPVPRNWFFPDMAGRQVLGLASGGGQQMPLFAAMGAVGTVFDLSSAQLAGDREVAAREQYPLTVVQGDMTQPLPFADASFDLICQPVANCYIQDVLPLWRECARILKPGGRLMVGLDNGLNYIVDEAEEKIARGLPFDPIKDPALLAGKDVMEDGIQFSHTLETQLRGQLQAGLQFVDMYEDTNGDGRLDALGIPSFWATLAEKKGA